jgi:hypothetical protein
MIRVVHSGSDFLPIPDPGSKGQKGTGSRIQDPDPQHWYTGTGTINWGLWRKIYTVKIAMS